MAPSNKQILSLYRQLLSKAAKFDNYNFREHAKRRVQDSFREHKALKDELKITAFYNEGVDNLAMLTRQTAISQMFTFDKLVVEPLKSHH
ncbi:hypothetical protein METBIDRAFT_42728 [Metschnikowia bicuspidata var. bicuspidata NRRL YB-4993]|uniref:Complex 1 LYR protein domain-containing protein n=1 Tax=Metschnikowia bicuspidata var. bicuspidata NRRL YB-4993 TaxID=869754 RepID=A0A1A0HBT3_9ASCO|nr:hypothetical protein METBIDRAFT_42728 [Metschnikowia bicuspidata var. bicuspidata NRRL YB-4993]OBA21471.1 hypothetical protein METBIDRAFT_42728 [Metschnikowia bicuspidata var. bicuspidata NRRL YB-4993]